VEDHTIKALFSGQLLPLLRWQGEGCCPVHNSRGQLVQGRGLSKRRTCLRPSAHTLVCCCFQGLVMIQCHFRASVPVSEARWSRVKPVVKKLIQLAHHAVQGRRAVSMCSIPFLPCEVECEPMYWPHLQSVWHIPSFLCQ